MLDKALALAEAGKLAEADAIYSDMLRKKAVSNRLLSHVIHFHNRYSRMFRRAVPHVQTLLKTRPKSADTHALAAETYANCSRFPLARHHAAQAAQLAPDNPDVLFVAAYAYLQSRTFDAALPLLDQALEIAPQHRGARLQKGRACLGLGRIADARALAHQLWAEAPDDLNAIGLYIDATKLVADDPVLIHMRDQLLPKLAAKGGLDHAHLLKLLGKAHNDLGSHHRALRYFTQARQVAPQNYDAKRYAQFVAQQCAAISRADYFGKGHDSQQPVLIVGMPRSGSTLLEQMLSIHPDIGSAGESPSLNVIVQSLGVRPHAGQDIVQAIKRMPGDAIAKIAAHYLEETAQDGQRLIIDKTPHNFELLGVFALLFPKARIIHMARDPLDTCVSCYMQNLSAWHRYTQTLDSLGHAYVLYHRLMQHWQKVLPNPIHTVEYEALVDSPDTVGRGVADFLGVDWRPEMRDFHTAENRSLTLSARQVREPLYKTAIGRWRNYEPDIDPLKRRLRQFYSDDQMTTRAVDA